MPATSVPVDPELLATLEGLELRARYIVDGYLSGMHRSPYRGYSAEFAEYRGYTPGDDIRYVDWKVFGKTDKVYLKQFEAETNLVCYLLLDVSDSMNYQSNPIALSKRAYCQALAIALAHIVLRQQDSVSLTTFDHMIRDLVPGSGNPTQLQRLVQVLEHTTGRHRSSIGDVLHELAQRLPRPGVVVLLSDLLDDPNTTLAGLKHLRHVGHELIVVHLLDPEEVLFRFDGPTTLRGLESQPEVRIEPRAIRQAYLAELRTLLEILEAGCRAMQADYHLLRTDHPLDVGLKRILSWKRK